MHKHHVCPWWIGYWLVNPLRRLVQDPGEILAGRIRPGMTVLDVGSGMGFWTVPMARLVGASGRVVALDVQDRMLTGLKRRARRAGVGDWVDARLTPPDRLAVEDLAGKIDFALAFAVVHEVPSASVLMAELHAALRPGGRLLVAEPSGRVPDHEFAEELAAAEEAGFKLIDRPAIVRSRTALLEKAGGPAGPGPASR